MLNDLCKEAHANAKEKGFWDEDKDKLTVYALVHSEISEAVECARDPNLEFDMYVDPVTGKPEGELVEIADAMIRLFDYCGYMNWDLESAIKVKMAYNKTRPYKHGKLI